MKSNLALLAAFGVFSAGCAGASRAALPVEHPGPTAPAPAAEPVAEPTPEEPKALPFHMPCAEDDLAACTKGCEEQHVEDCVTLGGMYLAGALVTADPERAVGMFRSACETGSARGCMKLGDAYHAGIARGGESDELDAYKQACEGGANLGCVAAAKAYLGGRGAGVDPVYAAALFKKACEKGNAPACFELARLHKAGEGVPRDAERADALFVKACELGMDEGCHASRKKGEVAISPRE